MGIGRPLAAIFRHAWHALLILVPKLLLGNVQIWPKLCLGTLIIELFDCLTNTFAKQSFASKWVPKRELGNQNKQEKVTEALNEYKKNFT